MLVNSLAELREWLGVQPSLRWSEDAAGLDGIHIEAPSPDGFSVWISDDDQEWTVGFDGWHDHFESEADAVGCAAWGLSGECRVRIDYRGKWPYRWVVESKRDGDWNTEFTLAIALFPFWRRKRSEYRQNPKLYPSDGA